MVIIAGAAWKTLQTMRTNWTLNSLHKLCWILVAMLKKKLNLVIYIDYSKDISDVCLPLDFFHENDSEFLMHVWWFSFETLMKNHLCSSWHFLCNPYAVLMLFWKLHILFKSHAFLRNGMKEHKDCIRLCLLRVKVWKKFIRRTQEILKKKSWSLDPRSLLKCVKSTNVNISNEVSFFALWSDTLGSKGHLITLKHTQMKLMTKSADIHSIYNSYRGIFTMSQNQIETPYPTV